MLPVSCTTSREQKSEVKKQSFFSRPEKKLLKHAEVVKGKGRLGYKHCSVWAL